MPGNLQKGSVITIFALVAVLVLVPITALVVDGAYLYVVKRELQNAADAAALAGANQLMPPTSSGQPNWARAETKALAAVKQNKSIGLTNQLLSTASVESGYWNRLTQLFVVLSEAPASPATSMIPAIRVTVRRSGTENQGPVVLFFSKIFNIAQAPVGASAISAVRRPGGLTQGSSLPIGIQECAIANAWNSTTKQPISPPVPIRIGEGTGSSNPCYNGIWLSFSASSVSATTVSQIIIAAYNQDPTGPKSPAIAIGDTTNGASTAVMTSLYEDITSCLKTNTCRKIALPIVSGTASPYKVQNFACVQLVNTCCPGNKCTLDAGKTCGISGTSKYAEFNLTTDCRVETYGTTTDTTYSVYEPARLNQ